VKDAKLCLLAAPVVLAGLLAAAVLRQPSDHASAYSTGDSAIYSATTIITTSAPAQAPAAAPRKSSHGAANSVPIPAAAAVPPSPLRPTGFDVRGGPSITVDQINQVLGDYGSPMAGMGQTIYDLGVKYGIDPAYCLAFFVHESAAGTRGEAVLTHSVGNIRPVAGAPSKDGYRYYDTWQEGAEDWYRLISKLYVNSWDLTSVDKIIPVYAPSGDNNDPTAYIDDVEQLVTAWRAQA
jgi:hypothetical protein